MNQDIFATIADLAAEQKIDQHSIRSIVEDAISEVISKFYSDIRKPNVFLNENWNIVYKRPLIVSSDSSISDDSISIKDAKKIKTDVSIGDTIEIESDFILKRYEIESIKKLIIKSLQEKKSQQEYDMFLKLFENKNNLIEGRVREVLSNYLIVEVYNIGSAILFKKSLMYNEFYNKGDKIVAYLEKVQKSTTNFNFQAILSRIHPNFLGLYMTKCIPEIEDGILEIKNIVRDPGSRAKVGVLSNDPRIDPVSVCVGFNGSRISLIRKEFRGEKIDIIPWNNDIKEVARKSMPEVNILHVSIVDEAGNIEVVVPDQEVKLAIGKGGQNARLASNLIGSHISIVSESDKIAQNKDFFFKSSEMLERQLKIDKPVAGLLVSEGLDNVSLISEISVDNIARIQGFDDEIAKELNSRAKLYVSKQIQEIEALGIDINILKLLSMKSDYAIHLFKNNINTINDIADLSIDDFLDIVPFAIIQDVHKIIISARNKQHLDNK